MKQKKVSKDKIELSGKVVSANSSIFVVEIESGAKITCTISGKIRTNNIRILVEDKVLIEVSEYDTSKGRIVVRY